MKSHRALRIEQSPLERARLWIEILAFFAAGCWAIYTFIYETKIAPAFLPAHEVLTVSVQRLAQLPQSYLERITLTFHNDGAVDVDAAALAENVYGARPEAFSNRRSLVTSYSADYDTVPESAWKIVQSSASLFDGAVSGRKGQHLILRAGDTFSVESVAVVPRSYRAIAVRVQAIFDRYPISPPIAVQVIERQGAVSLKSKWISTGFDSYFSV